MMKRILQIVLLGLAAPLVAVEVPQTSAADYIFTVPRLTNHIHGVLVDTTNSYGVIRSEDIDWLREAFSERQHIVLGYVPKPPWDGVGPRVSISDPPTSLSGYWLDGDAPLLDGIRLYGAGVKHVATNAYVLATFTNGVTNALSVITMPMANGGFSVFTNRWSTYQKLFASTNAVTNVVTNAFSRVDLCHGVDGAPFPAYSNLTRVSWWTYDETFKRFPNVKVIEYGREALRGTVRLADVSNNSTNTTLYISTREWDDIDRTHRSSETNWVVGVGGGVSAQHDGAQGGYFQAYNADIPTRFTTALVTTGGAQRVSIEAVYVHLQFGYSDTDYMPGGVDVSVTTNAVVRLTAPSLDLSGEQAICHVQLDSYGLCSACAEAAGVPAPPRDTSYRAAEGHSEGWWISGEYECFTIFYSITPSTKLPDW
jgi:hypothetical protein